jgi:hypothetical protein
MDRRELALKPGETIHMNRTVRTSPDFGGDADHSFPTRADVLSFVGLFFFGVALCLHYGRMGFFPLDQSVVFDGAWRLYRDGQIPYRDFFTPTCSVPILIQAGLFAFLGPTWFAYCIHAALFNGLFVVLAMALLRSFGLATVPAIIFSALTGVVMYTPGGTPFGDQHAMFFVTVTLAMSLLAVSTPYAWAQRLLWLTMPLAMALAIFSKQNPGFLAVAMGLAPLFFVSLRQAARALGLIALGGAATAAGLVLLGASLGLQADLFWYFFWQLPLETGTDRLMTIPSPTRSIVGCQIASVSLAMIGLPILLAAGLRRDALDHAVLGWLRLPLLALTVLLFAILLLGLGCDLSSSRIKIVATAAASIVVVAAGAAVAAWAVTSEKSPARNLSRIAALRIPAILVGLALLLLDIFFTITTNNNPQMCFPHAFIAAGLLYDTLRSTPLAAAATPLARMSFIAPALLSACILDAAVWNFRFNATRWCNEFFKAPLQTVPGSMLSPRFTFMLYDIPLWSVKVTRGSGRDAYIKAADFFREHPGAFFWLGDFTVMHALTDRPSISPWLFLHKGLSLPQPGTPRFEWLEDELIRRIISHDCRYIIIESEKTFQGVSLEDFARLRDFIARHEKERMSIEKIQIVRIQ